MIWTHLKIENFALTQALRAQIGAQAVVHVWDAEEQRILSLLQKGHSGGVGAVAFSASGEVLASSGMDAHHTIVLWNWKKGFQLSKARLVL